MNFNKGSNTHERRGIVLTSCQCRFVLLNLGDVPRYFFSNRMQCSFGNLLGMPALMVEFDKSQRVPGKVEQNLKDRNLIIWCEFTA